MVVKITSPYSVRRLLNYHEQKVQRGQAVCIRAANFLQDAPRLNFYDKLSRFQHLISLNERAQKSNILHISLNFDPSEKLSMELLSNIADSYMKKIGFAGQPFLVYKHQDAGHPHMHIVTTNIEAGGKRIDTFNIGRLKSEPARKEIESEFGLVRAAGRIDRQKNIDSSQIIEYGKSETKRAITNVLDKVVKYYNYNSLATLNAILKTYNITADRGREGGRIHKYKGLIYHILDSKGDKMGVPIKASAIYSKPTLVNLEMKMAENEKIREPFCRKLKATIDFELLKSPRDLHSFINALREKDIKSVLRQNKDGVIYGITFVDHGNKSVFNGSEIGRNYSVSALQKRFAMPLQNMQEPVRELRHTRERSVTKNDLMKNLLKPEENAAATFVVLRKKRKKKRRF